MQRRAGSFLMWTLVGVSMLVPCMGVAQETEPTAVPEAEVLEGEIDPDLRPATLEEEPVKPKDPLEVMPLIINEKGKPRDIIKDAFTLTNNKHYKVNIYAQVYNFDPSAGQEANRYRSGSELADSLANWIELTRGVIELEPGETIQIPYLIHINLRAKPGLYHAQIVFSEGSNRAVAEANHQNEKRVMATIEVQDDGYERLELGMFLPDQSVFAGKAASFTYALENLGNRSVAPRGEIRIYNRRGQEVATLPANESDGTISPEGKRQLAAVWDATGRFGKYKAFLDLEYGQTGSVQDSVYFWVFPWRELFIGFLLLLIAAASITYLFHIRQTYQRQLAYQGSSTGGAGLGGSVNFPSENLPEPEPSYSTDTVSAVSSNDSGRDAGTLVAVPSRPTGVVTLAKKTEQAPAAPLAATVSLRQDSGVSAPSAQSRKDGVKPIALHTQVKSQGKSTTPTHEHTITLRPKR